MRTFVSLFSISLFLLLTWHCNPMFSQREERSQPVESTPNQELNSHRQLLEADLTACRERLDEGIASIDRRLRRANRESRKSLNNLRDRLERERTRVDAQLSEIKSTTTDSWATISIRSKEILTDAKIEAQKVEESVENLF